MIDIPFVIVFLIGSAWGIMITLSSRREVFRQGALMCSSVFLSLAVVETCFYFAVRPQTIVVRTNPVKWLRNESDMGIGSRPAPNTAVAFEEALGGREIDKVTYKFSGSGLRDIPASVQGGPYTAVFFGCSFMFGHGVEDDQTLPYYFVRASKGSFKGFNFAGEGWGPHQMLREIETGFTHRVAGTPDLAIYEAIPDHLRRVAGRAPWEDGPKYDLCQDNEACYTGQYHSAEYATCRRWLDRCWIVKFFETHFGKLSQPSDLPLYLAVLRRTRTLLEQNGTHFVVVLWNQNELANTIMKALKANRFDVVALSSIFPESSLKNGLLTQLDRHPSPATNEKIATYLWKQVGEPMVAAKHLR